MPIANIPLPVYIRSSAPEHIDFVATLRDFSSNISLTDMRSSTKKMFPLASMIVVASILLSYGTTASSKTSRKIEDRSEILKNSRDVYYETLKRDKREPEDENEPREEEEEEEEAVYSLRRESSADELAAAVGFSENVGYRDTGNYVNEHPRQATTGEDWRDAVPGTPGMDYPILDGIPVTSFTCVDKEPGGYYADVETGCQVFHVCNTGGVKSSFLCPSGSIFNQKHFVCDWWYGFNCQEAVDYYFKKSQLNSPDFNENNSTSVNENFDTIDEVPENYDSGPGNYFQETTPSSNPSNDLSLASSSNGRPSTTDHSSSYQTERINKAHYNKNNVRGYSTGTRNLKILNNVIKESNIPRGFSRDDNESLKKFDRTSYDLTNDLASYVNYAYFQAGLNNDRIDNDEENNDDNVEDNSGESKFARDPKKEWNFGDKLIYSKSSEYPERDETYQSSKSIDDEYE